MPQDDTSRDQAARITITAAATPPTLRGRPWTVEAGRWRTEGATKKAASDALAAGLRAFLDQHRPPMVLPFRGCVAVVTPDLAGGALVWRQQIAFPNGDVAESREEAADWVEAAARARYALAEYTTDWHDDNSVREAAAYLERAERFGFDDYGPEALYRGAAWVRAAQAARDDGRPDYYQWAFDHSHDPAFAVPRAAQVQAASPTPAPEAVAAAFQPAAAPGQDPGQMNREKPAADRPHPAGLARQLTPGAATTTACPPAQTTTRRSDVPAPASAQHR